MGQGAHPAPSHRKGKFPMTVKQISVFVENKEGKLAEFTEFLAQHQVDMRALSLADTRDFGILRLIVQDPEQTARVLEEAGCVFSTTEVLAVEIPDEPGSFSKVLKILSEEHISVEYTYAFITPKAGSACMIFRVADNEKAAQALQKSGVSLISQQQLSQL